MKKLVSLILFLLLSSFVAGDGMHFPPPRIVEYDFSAIQEKQQYAVIEVQSNYFEKINMYLALSSLDFEPYNTTLVIPLKSIPQDVDASKLTSKEFLSKYEFDRIRERITEESLGEFVKRTSPKTEGILEDYLLSSAFSPLYFLTKLRPEYRVYGGLGVFNAGIMESGKGLPPGVTHIKHFEFEWGYMDIYGVESGQSLKNFLKEYHQLDVPENVKEAVDKYNAYYIAVLNLEIKPIADISPLKKYAPNTLKEAIDYVRKNPELTFTCREYDYGRYHGGYPYKRCDEREIVKEKFSNFIEKAKREYIRNVRQEPVKSTITNPKEKLWESVDDGQYVLNKDAEYFEATASYFTSECFPDTYDYDGIEFRLNYIKNEYHARIDLSYNKKVTIPVDSIAREFYLLVGGNTGNVYLDTRKYVYSTDIDLKLIYEDGTEKKISAEIPWDWSSGRDYNGINSKTISIGKNPCDPSSRAAMYVIKYTNPYPEKGVKYIELSDGFTAEYPHTNIVAITLSQKKSHGAVPTGEIETAMIDFFLSAYSNKTKGTEISMTLPIKNNEVFYPLGTGTAWSTPIEDTKILVRMDKNLEANFEHVQSSTIYKDKRYCFWEFKNWNPDYDVTGILKQVGFRTQVSDSIKLVIASMNKNSVIFAWIFAFLTVLIAVGITAIIGGKNLLSNLPYLLFLAISAPLVSVWIAGLLPIFLRTEPSMKEFKSSAKKVLIFFGVILIAYCIYILLTIMSG